MICSAEEAKDKWCPFVRVSTGAIVIAKSRGDSNNCLANKCMAWVNRSSVEGRCGMVEGTG